jgi:hypothetical protein
MARYLRARSLYKERSAGHPPGVRNPSNPLKKLSTFS